MKTLWYIKLEEGAYTILWCMKYITRHKIVTIPFHNELTEV